MRNINNSTISKDYVLSKVSQIKIFSKYLNISEDVIKDCINNGTLISNPLRVDIHPSAGFRYNNKNKLKFRDFGNEMFWGDCFDVAAYVISNAYNIHININNKNDFMKVLKHIMRTFKDIFYGTEKDENLDNEINIGINNIRNRKNVIELVIRNWEDYDINYWKQFDIDISLLNTNFVYPIDQFYINRNINPEPKYYHNKKDLCYGYILGQDKHGIYNIKLYFPNRKKGDVRFITNCNHIEGVLNFNTNDKYDYIIITKSTKDRLALKSYLSKTTMSSFLYGQATIGLINIPCESYKLKDREYEYLLNNIKDRYNIISLMDNDMVGKKEAIYLKKEFNITPILIPKEYECKDFAELRQNYSIQVIDNLFKDVINYIQEDENIEIDWNTEESNTLPF